MTKTRICPNLVAFADSKLIVPQRLGGGGFFLKNPLADMRILGSLNSAANKDMTSKIWTNWDTVV